MVSIAACHAVDRSSILLGTAKFLLGSSIGLGHMPFTYVRRVRFPYPVPKQYNGGRVVQCNGLQIRKAGGSNPSRCSKLEMWQRGRLRQTVNLFLTARWFESIRLHQTFRVSPDSLTQTMRSAVTSTGGSETKSFTQRP